MMVLCSHCDHRARRLGDLCEEAQRWADAGVMRCNHYTSTKLLNWARCELEAAGMPHLAQRLELASDGRVRLRNRKKAA